MSETKVEIIRRSDDAIVEATLLEELQPSDLVMIEREWTPIRSQIMQDLIAEGVPRA